MGEQQVNDGFAPSSCGRIVERCGTNMRRSMHVSTMLQQEGDYRRVPTNRSNVQRCPAVSISGVDLCALGQQRCHLL